MMPASGKLIKYLLANLLCRLRFAALYGRRTHGDPSNPRLLIIRYHRVFEAYDQDLYPLGITKTNFEHQIAFLSSQYRVLPLDHAVHALQTGLTLPPQALCITFDDGYKDNYINAYPILKGYGVPATIYVVTKYINAKELLPWDRLK
jgi:peptidoglycan/xylan/chitin deacetylase (PgdA/CDA1 family)